MYGNEKVLPKPFRDTKFSGLHKDSCAARGLGARTRASPFQTVLKKQAQSGSCVEMRERVQKIKLKLKLKTKRVPYRNSRVRLLLDNGWWQPPCVPVYGPISLMIVDLRVSD